ncbi:putative lipoyltransferase 2, mitochondrial [Acanthaster planci]|uniref:Octanoyl-[acyl-carrier-protein]:protein N-octanoyltransferase LIPT2, mitochondrial n=1 Tax=Acanthaster planci TaxID=133434 RepID=A0A8B7YZS8_ACAPL|nr:putative lipoyltransferase 2, mitochondrial [Acanthaster planci]XP_022098015.1 putative lipoyltransferase 2, mitochondrial [Acanthaster planci]
MVVNHSVSFVVLGRIAYHRALKLQKLLKRCLLDRLYSAQTGHSQVSDMLLICEHEPVFTVGVRNTDYPATEEQRLKALGADFHRTNRGGLITFHGPGQLIAYPIINLTHYNKSVRWYISQLEKTVINTSKEFGVAANIQSSDRGVWVKDNKLAAIGIQCSRYVTMHGLSLNCNTELSWFDHIVPCGVKNKGVTSLSLELKQNITVQEVLPVFLEAFAKQFSCLLVESKETDLPRNFSS